jgi:thioredoxin-related protein
MKRWLAGLVALTLICRAGAEELEWLTDVPAAMQKAKTDNKIVLLDFTGSDWCVWCKRLKGEVFDQPEFAPFAKSNLVMVEVDFPREKPQSDDQKQANAALAERYHITGYPTIILLNAGGEQVGQTGYLEGGPPAFIAELEKIPGIKHVDVASTPAEPADPPRHAPVYAPLPQVAPVQYGDLALKGISIGPAGRMAMINNETLAVGESASIKVKDGHVEVVCKEIRDDSALVTVDGKLVELKMGQH